MLIGFRANDDKEWMNNWVSQEINLLSPKSITLLSSQRIVFPHLVKKLPEHHKTLRQMNSKRYQKHEAYSIKCGFDLASFCTEDRQHPDKLPIR